MRGNALEAGGFAIVTREPERQLASRDLERYPYPRVWQADAGWSPAKSCEVKLLAPSPSMAGPFYVGAAPASREECGTVSAQATTRAGRTGVSGGRRRVLSERPLSASGE